MICPTERLWRPASRGSCLSPGLGLVLLGVWAWTVAGRGAEVPGAAPSPGSEAPREAAQPYRLPLIEVTGDLIPATSPLSDASSVSLLTGAAAQERSLLSPRDLTTITPNLTVFDANGDRVPRFSIRGLRENNFSVGEPSVTLYVDDVPYNDLSSRGLALFDLQQLDFLRGPQGTLFGASRPGGVINIMTRLPDNTWRGQAGGGYGSYDSIAGEAAVSGPAVQDRLYVGVSGLYQSRDGFMDNQFLGTHPDTRETFAGRAVLRYTPSEPWDLTLTVSGEQYNDGAVAIGPVNAPDPFRFDRDYDGFVDSWGLTEALRVAYRSGALKVVSVTTHRDWEQDLVQDFDFSTNDLVRGFTYPRLEQWSQEFRVQSSEDAETLSWVAGVFFSSRAYDANSGSRYTGIPLPVPPFYLPGPFDDRTTAELEDRNYAAFGQATWEAVPRLALTAGLRFDYDQRAMVRQHVNEPAAVFGAPPIPGQDLEDDFSAFQPRMAVAYEALTNLTAFGSVTAGYQSGGYHVSSDDPSQSGYDECTSLHYEIGLRSDWLERRLGANLSLFLADYDDYQVFRPVTSTQFIMLNADQAQALGVELELVAQPWTPLLLTATFGWVQAEFDSFLDPTSGVDYSGRTINFVPEYTWNLGARYRFPLGFFARVEAQGIGQFYFDEANTLSEGPYVLLHARVGWENDRFSVAVFGRNLTDQVYYNNAINFRDPTFNSDFFVGTPGDPRVIGFSASARF